MLWLCLALVAPAFLISLVLTAVMVRVGRRLDALDAGGVAGQVKERPRRVPNVGGVAIFWAVALPILGGIAVFAPMAGEGSGEGASLLPGALRELLPTIADRAPAALGLVGSLLLLHVLGLIDDRRPLPPLPKLAVMAIPAVAFPLISPETRLLTLLDDPLGGAWASIALTALWFLVVTNAMNFMDNMDGLSAGVTAVAASAFLAATLLQAQWLVASVLALTIGASLGFLVFNFPPARIFMGDGGSLVLGFLLAFTTVRTTYVGEDMAAGPAGAWYGVFMPLVVLAVPLYDFASVVLIRLAAGRSPFVGDLNHLSHRLVRLGLSRRAAVLLIWALTAATSIGGVSLATLAPWQAALAGAQTLLVVGVVALLEWGRERSLRRTREGGDSGRAYP